MHIDVLMHFWNVCYYSCHCTNKRVLPQTAYAVKIYNLFPLVVGAYIYICTIVYTFFTEVEVLVIGS